MTTIILTDPTRATAASRWAIKNVGEKDWDISMPHMISSNPQYHFKFRHKKDAVLFSLKWL